MRDISKTAKASLEQWTRLRLEGIRDAVKDAHLPEEQLAALTPAICQGLYDALHSVYLLARPETDDQGSLGALRVADWLSRATLDWRAPSLGRRNEALLARLKTVRPPSSDHARVEFERFLVEGVQVFTAPRE
jgi:hypothetical protein